MRRITKEQWEEFVKIRNDDAWQAHGDTAELIFGNLVENVNG